MAARPPGARRILAVAPHALDEALGCGGTLARHAREGDAVEVLVLFGDGTGGDAPRRASAATAAAALGVPVPSFAGFPENRGDRIALSDLVGTVEAALRRHEPDIVYVPSGHGLHIDHQVAFKAAATAARPLPGSPVRGLYAYEILSSTEWAPGPGQFRPTLFVDIRASLPAKLAAVACYAADARPAPHARSPEAIQALAASRGAQVGLPAAEAFEVLRQLVPAI